ncbi:MAG: hypothetical protein H6608_05210 [Flavobacteriales bacterium]|nr:hypothetical protein [Bacteroidota bacterium]MCB9240503.1 hypothetical protein [Flavobacteriales bacterium]
MKTTINYLVMTILTLFSLSGTGVYAMGTEVGEQPGAMSPDIESDGSPISQTLLGQLRQEFQTAYKWQTNSSIVDMEWKANWSDLVNYLDTNWLKGASDTGIALHYILREENGTQYFSYAITFATLSTNGVNVLNNPNHNNEMLVFTTTGIQTMNTSELSAMKQRYQDSISVYDVYPNGTSYRVSELTHPKLIYYSGDNVYNFVMDNAYQSTGEYVLHVFNGAVYNDNITVDGPVPVTIGLHVQTPVLVMGSSSNLFISNNYNQSIPFKEMGLDLGRLCPPHCSK